MLSPGCVHALLIRIAERVKQYKRWDDAMPTKSEKGPTTQSGRSYLVRFALELPIVTCSP